MGSVLLYLLLGLLLTALWLLVALGTLPGGLKDVGEFSLSGWPAVGLLFLVPTVLIWMALWLVRLQRRVGRLQQLTFDYGNGPLQAPTYPPPHARERTRPVEQQAPAEPWREGLLTEAWRESPEPEGQPMPQPTRAPKRVAFSTLDPLPPEREQAGWAALGGPAADGQEARAPRAPVQDAFAPSGQALRNGGGVASATREGDADWPPASMRRAANGQGAFAGAAEGAVGRRGTIEPAAEVEAAAARPRRARLPEPEPGEQDTSAEPLSDELEPHRPPRAAPNAPRLEALSPTYRRPSEVPTKALSPEEFAGFEARIERELNAVAMDLASIVSAPQDYDHALTALNGGATEAFFQLLARDFQSADRATLRQQLAMVGGDGMLETYLEKYEQLLVIAYRSDPGGGGVRRLVDSAMGRLHQAIETYRQDTAHG